MKKILFTTLTILCFYGCSKNSLDGQEQTSSSPESKLGHLYGIVVDKSNAEPMRAIGVELYVAYYQRNMYNNSDNIKRGSMVYKSVTYEDGHYEINDLEPQYYILSLIANGYTAVNEKILINANLTTRIDLQMEKIPEVDTGITIKTLDVSSIEGNKATFNGEYKYNSRKVEYVGFIYGQTENLEQNGISISADVESSTTSGKNYQFSRSVSGLKSGIYYVRAYATNDYGTKYGEIQSFEIE